MISQVELVEKMHNLQNSKKCQIELVEIDNFFNFDLAIYKQFYFALSKIILYLLIFFNIIIKQNKFKVAYEQNENNDRKQESVYSKRIKAGKRRTYFFDIRETRGSDFYLTITESRKRFDSDGYDRHKIFVYKEDFNKFVKGLIETVDYVKTDLMPDFDFDAFNHDTPYEGDDANHVAKTEDVSTEVVNANEPAVTVTETEKITNEATEPIIAALPQDNGSAEVVDKW